VIGGLKELDRLRLSRKSSELLQLARRAGILRYNAGLETDFARDRRNRNDGADVREVQVAPNEIQQTYPQKHPAQQTAHVAYYLQSGRLAISDHHPGDDSD
jgi:hypothetical protein